MAVTLVNSVGFWLISGLSFGPRSAPVWPNIGSRLADCPVTLNPNGRVLIGEVYGEGVGTVGVDRGGHGNVRPWL